MAGSDPAVRLAKRVVQYVGRPTKNPRKFLPPNDPKLDCDLELWELAQEVLTGMEGQDALLRAIAQHPGAIGSAIRLLKWWAGVGADPDVIDQTPLVNEAVMQSRETVRELMRIQGAARKGRKGGR